MSTAMSSTATRSFNNTSGLYCPACEEPYAPAPPHHPPVLLSPCGHSLCAACFSALPPPAQCLICSTNVESHTSNTFLAELAAEMLCGGSCDGQDFMVGVECAASVAEGGAGSGVATSNPPMVELTSTDVELGGCDGNNKRPRPDDEAGVATTNTQFPSQSVCPSCPGHLPLSAFCMTHKNQCCECCAASNHASPECEVVDTCEAAARLRQSVTAHATKCAAAASSKYPAAITRVQSVLEGLKGQWALCIERVNASVQEIIAGVEAHRARVLGQIDALYRERVKSLEATLDRLVVSVGQLEACVAVEAKQGTVGSNLAKAAELESLCGGMAALCDAYVGVDVPPCMDVGVDVAGVLAAVENCSAVTSRGVCDWGCRISGSGIKSFMYGSNVEARKHNTFKIACVDNDGAALEWLCAEDVRVSVCGRRVIMPAGGGLVQCPQRITDQTFGSCVVSSVTARGSGRGVFEVRYEVPALPAAAVAAAFSGKERHELEVCVTVCGVVLGAPDYDGYVTNEEPEDGCGPVFVPEYSAYVERRAREAIECVNNKLEDDDGMSPVPTKVLRRMCDAVSACVAASEDVVVHACLALGDVGAAYTESIEGIVSVGGLARVIFPGMDAHVASMAVQEAACSALLEMLLKTERKHRVAALHVDVKAAIVSDGGLERVRRAQDSFESLRSPRLVLEFLKKSL